MRFKIMCRADGSCVIKNISRKGAIAMFCLGCGGYSYKERENCQMAGCELHPYRMGPKISGPEETKKRARAISAFCLSCCCGSTAERKACSAPTCPLYPFRGSRVDKTYQIKYQTEEEATSETQE
jgi:hypothetical protein